MPPQRDPAARRSSRANAFGRAHPTLQRALLYCCQLEPYFIIATILVGARIWKRPAWQHAALWWTAVWGFMSRWILVGCAMTWTWNDWGPGREGEAQVGGGEGRDQGS